MRKFLTEDDPVVPVHHPRILLDTAAKFGAEPAAVLEGAGLTLEALAVPETRLSYRQLAVLERNALALTKNPALGLHAGRNTRLSSAGMLSMAAMNSATGRDAVELMIRYHDWLTPGWDMELIEDERSAVLRLGERLRGDLKTFAAEWVAAGTLTLAKEILRGAPALVIRFDYPAPAHAALYTDFLRVPVEFEAPAFEALLDVSLLAAPLPGADPAMATLAERYVATAAVPAAGSGGLIAEIRGMLGARDGSWPDLDEVARALQTSGRSLRRELGRLRTSYTEVVDSVRTERAERLLCGTDLTLERIATQLGFADVRTFRRAFKRWTGRTPNAVRTQLRDPAHKQSQ